MASCAPQPSQQPEEIETVDVGPAADAIIDPEADPRAAPRRVVEMAGILPGDFPAQVPLYQPSSLTDHGEGKGGLRFVELTIPEPAKTVQPGYYQALQTAGFASLGDGSSWQLDSLVIQVTLSPAGSDTVLRIDYPTS